MRAADEVYTALSTARTLPGWTVTRLGPDKHRVTSPSGTAVICTDDADAAEDAVADLETLGLTQDVRHAPTPQPIATIPAFAPQPEPEPQPEPDLVVVPHEAPASATEQETLLVPSPATTRRRKLTVFTYPDEPQEAPSVDAVMPEAFAGKGRCVIPALVVTPEIAEAWLELVADTHNRKKRGRNVEMFERIIMGGEFTHTHQGAAFNDEGRCADAQHRLRALVNVAERHPDQDWHIVLDVTFNASAKAAKHYDSGLGRDAKDKLNVEGLAGDTASMIRLLWSYEGTFRQGVTAFKSVTPMTGETLIEWGHEHSEALKHHLLTVQPILRAMRKETGALLNASVAAVVRHLAHRASENNRFDEFLLVLAEPTTHKVGSPQRALVQWLRGNAVGPRRADAQMVMAMTLIAYNDYSQDQGRRVMSWQPRFGMPQVYGGADAKKAPAKKR